MESINLDNQNLSINTQNFSNIQLHNKKTLNSYNVNNILPTIHGIVFSTPTEKKILIKKPTLHFLDLKNRVHEIKSGNSTFKKQVENITEENENSFYINGDSNDLFRFYKETYKTVGQDTPLMEGNIPSTEETYTLQNLEKDSQVLVGLSSAQELTCYKMGESEKEEEKTSSLKQCRDFSYISSYTFNNNTIFIGKRKIAHLILQKDLGDLGGTQYNKKTARSDAINDQSTVKGDPKEGHKIVEIPIIGVWDHTQNEPQIIADNYISEDHPIGNVETVFIHQTQEKAILTVHFSASQKSVIRQYSLTSTSLNPEDGKTEKSM